MGQFASLPIVSGAESIGSGDSLGSGKQDTNMDLPDDEQKEVWEEIFRVIGTLQFMLGTLSSLGTRARVKALASRSRVLLTKLLEEREAISGQNYFAAVLLQEGDGSEDERPGMDTGQ